MNYLKKLLVKLKKPRFNGWLVVFYLVTALLIAASLIFVVHNTLSPLLYVIFALTALSLTYAVYSLIFFIPSIKACVVKQAQKHKFTSDFLFDYGFRAYVLTIFSLIINVLYALFEGILAIYYLSIWYGALAIYYLILCVMRQKLIFTSRKNSKMPLQSERKRKLRQVRRTESSEYFLLFCTRLFRLRLRKW